MTGDRQYSCGRCYDDIESPALIAQDQADPKTKYLCRGCAREFYSWTDANDGVYVLLRRVPNDEWVIDSVHPTVDSLDARTEQVSEEWQDAVGVDLEFKWSTDALPLRGEGE